MKKAIILLSGGIDSALVLAKAKEAGYQCCALTFDYNQRHRIELEAARQIARDADEHRIISLNINQWGGSALTDAEIEMPSTPTNDVPTTYVPARNTMFLSIALSWAEAIGAYDIFMGANQDDYTNYPDCRPEYMNAFEQLAKFATRVGTEGGDFHVHAPLLNMGKAEIVREAARLNIDFSQTISCYNPSSEGGACGVCGSCRLRITAFQQTEIEDQPYHVK